MTANSNAGTLVRDDLRGRDGPTDDFADQLARLRSSLHARALFLAQDPTAADDLVQDALERALVARDRFRRGTHLKAWLCSILRNLFIDGRRRVAARARVELEAERERDRDEALGPAGEGEAPADLLSPDDLAEALARLDEAQRRVFELACVDGLSYQEVGERLGIPASTVGTRLLRSKRRLRNLLAPVYEQRLEQSGARWLPCGQAVG